MGAIYNPLGSALSFTKQKLLTFVPDTAERSCLREKEESARNCCVFPIVAKLCGLESPRAARTSPRVSVSGVGAARRGTAWCSAGLGKV